MATSPLYRPVQLTMSILSNLIDLTNSPSPTWFSRRDAPQLLEKLARNETLSEIDGGPLPTRKSLYLHLEQGLASSFNELAIISTSQPANHFDDLLEAKSFRNNTLEHKAKTKPATNGISQHQVSNPDCLKLTFGELHYIAQNLAAGLFATGAQSNTTMLLLIDNVAEYGLLLWTATLMRLTIACADLATLRTSGGDGLRDMLRSLKPSIIVVSNAHDAAEVRSRVDELKLAPPIIICLETFASRDWTTISALAAKGSISSIDRYVMMEAARNDGGERIHSILFTSGTSGKPKGCPSLARNTAHVLQSQAWLLSNGAHKAALQQAHPSRGIATAQVMQTWRAGGAVVMTNSGFSVKDAMDAIREHEITFLVLTPPMVHSIAEEVKREKVDAGCVRAIQVGGDAVTKSVLEACKAVFPRARVFVNHGMTEGAGCFVWPFSGPTSPIPYFGGIAPIGTVAPGSSIRIRNVQTGAIVKRTEPGELHVSGGSLIRHYLFGRSEESFYVDQDGRRWFNTGDIAVVDTTGVVSILGRRKDMIWRDRGNGIMPAPIECCIEEFTGSTAVVTAVESREGMMVWAVVREVHNEKFGKIQMHVEESLGTEYALDGVLSLKQLGMEQFPVNGTHKIMKEEVKRLVTELVWRQ